MWKRIKASISRYFENLAKENKELYGTGRMDCCNLNNANNTNTIKKK